MIIFVQQITTYRVDNIEQKCESHLPGTRAILQSTRGKLVLTVNKLHVLRLVSHCCRWFSVDKHYPLDNKHTLHVAS